LKRPGFPEVPTFSGWRSSCPYGWRASRVSSSSLFDRADAGIWTKRQPAVQGLVSRHHVRGVPASGLNDVPKRERPRQLQKRRRRGGRVCSRRRAAHRCCSGCAERPRCSSVPIGPFAYWPGLRLPVRAAATARRSTSRYRPPNLSPCVAAGYEAARATPLQTIQGIPARLNRAGADKRRFGVTSVTREVGP
jgi:hypothetical protein